MDSSPLLLLLLLPLLFPLATADNSKLFTEYIGAEYKSVAFSDVPINPSVDFHFLLAFAIDYTTTTSPPSPTNGNFNTYWQTAVLTPEAVASIKQSNPNAKVGLSLGGDTVSGNDVSFSATSVSSWVSNAVSSITTIANQYHLDGIDIDYEHFGTDDVDTFVECIGQLVTTLKQTGVISFASIAPFDSADVQKHYQALWSKYGSVIDYVNFQFYAYSSDTTASQFLSYFEAQRANYGGGRVLASFTTGSGGGGLSPANGFFDACKTLQSEGELEGIFVWSADDSKSNGFQYEKQAQDLLASAN